MRPARAASLGLGVRTKEHGEAASQQLGYSTGIISAARAFRVLPSNVASHNQ
jgi:hypothetical protein